MQRLLTTKEDRATKIQCESDIINRNEVVPGFFDSKPSHSLALALKPEHCLEINSIYCPEF